VNPEENQTSNESPPADLTTGGDAQTPAEALPNTPLSKTHYLIAAVVGLIAPVVLIYAYDSRAFILYDSTLFLTAIYLFYVFKNMLTRRFNFHRINLPANVLIYSLIFYFGLIHLSRFIFDHSPVNLDFATATLSEKIFYYLAIGGLFAISAAASLIGFELENLPHNLYRLRHPLRFMILLLSLVVFIVTLGFITIYVAQAHLIMALSFLILITADLLLMLVYSLNCLLLSFIFLFTVFRNRNGNELRRKPIS
jgi:hypothetical protein